MTFDEMMEELKQDPERRETIEKAEIIADFLFENDYVDVVRCKDCANATPIGKYFFCEALGLRRLPTFFCASGERKDDDWQDN